jgi:hypothetical protein
MHCTLPSERDWLDTTTTDTLCLSACLSHLIGDPVVVAADDIGVSQQHVDVQLVSHNTQLLAGPELHHLDGDTLAIPLACQDTPAAAAADGPPGSPGLSSGNAIVHLNYYCKRTAPHITGKRWLQAVVKLIKLM